MIPKIIHYCWFGRGEMPPSVVECMDSWRIHMPDYEIRLWDEDNFDVDSVRYTREAYSQKKYAFVSDYVRLYALYREGGLYLDTDVMVLKSFDDLLSHSAFAGYEGSKHLPVGTCVLASEPGGEWVFNQLQRYQCRPFIMPDGTPDLTTNVVFITADMTGRGFVCDGKEKDFDGLHVFPVDFFSPRHTTGEYILTGNTHSDHIGLSSWCDSPQKRCKGLLYGTRLGIMMIKIKRKLLG